MPTPSLARIAGLDSLRFFCALWVMFGHVGPPPASVFPGPLEGLMGALLPVAFCGPAAVIVFFVISGLVIHYPNREGGAIAWDAFMVRRFVRILLPLGAAVAVGSLAGVSFAFLESTILWSLFAELIYYACYPVLLGLRRRFGWTRMIAVAGGLALAVVVVLNPHPETYHSFGLAFNWLVGLPCWLLGCRLAEAIGEPARPPVSVWAVWLMRGSVWAVSTLCLVLDHHTPIAYAYSLNAFALLVYAWLSLEIRHFRARPPLGVLEWAGTWSYSLYLFHLIGVGFIHGYLKTLAGHQPPIWPTLIGGTLVMTYMFYRLFEEPAHRLAKWGSARLRPRAQPGGQGIVTEARGGAGQAF